MAYLIGKSLGLESMSVDIEDTSYLSSYFNITDFNPIFGLGKNLLVINTTSLLSTTPNIQIEARDGANNYLYIESAQIVDAVSGKQKYYYSLHVYDVLSQGPGKITIVGNTIDGKKVRWSSNIVISTVTNTTSRIIFYSNPNLKISTIITYGLSSSVAINPKTIYGNFKSTAINPPKDFDIGGNFNKNNVDYRIIDTSANFDSAVTHFPITLNVSEIKPFGSTIPMAVSDLDSINIDSVLNKTTVLLESPYVYKNNKVSEITAGTYTCSFNYIEYKDSFFNSASYATVVTDFAGGTKKQQFSYGVIDYYNLGTFSGYITRHKLYKKSLSVAGDFQLILDESFSNCEFLRDISTPNKSFENMGTFFTQSHINNFWFTSSNSFGLYYDNSIFLNAMKISGSNVSDGYIIAKANTTWANRNASYIPYNKQEVDVFTSSSFDSNFLHFYPNNKYTLSFKGAILEKSISDVAMLNFYITSSSPHIQNETGYDINKGLLIGNLAFSSSAVSKIYDTIQSFDFSFLNDTYGALVIYGSGFTSSILSNVSISPQNKTGFSNYIYTTKVLFEARQPKDIFEIKSELYDTNGNLAYNNLNTVQYFDPNGVTLPVNFTGVGTTITATTLSSSNLVVENISFTNPTAVNTINDVKNIYMVNGGKLQGTSSWAENITASAIHGGYGTGPLTFQVSGSGIHTLTFTNGILTAYTP